MGDQGPIARRRHLLAGQRAIRLLDQPVSKLINNYCLLTVVISKFRRVLFLSHLNLDFINIQRLLQLPFYLTNALLKGYSYLKISALSNMLAIIQSHRCQINPIKTKRKKK